MKSLIEKQYGNYINSFVKLKRTRRRQKNENQK